MVKQKKFKCRIQVSQDGPYLVIGHVPLAAEKIMVDKSGYPLKWQKIKDYPLQESYALCRCGQSGNKPYCDGSHTEAKFKGLETASKEKYDNRANEIEGPELILKDLPELCSVARFCDRAGGVWDLTENSGDPSAKEVAQEEACNCPSGRLVMINKRTGKRIEPDFEASISATEDPEPQAGGPLWVKGGIEIESVNGEKYEVRNRATLCRCGHSRNKPYCDGTHRHIRFKI